MRTNLNISYSPLRRTLQSECGSRQVRSTVLPARSASRNTTSPFFPCLELALIVIFSLWAKSTDENARKPTSQAVSCQSFGRTFANCCEQAIAQVTPKRYTRLRNLRNGDIAPAISRRHCLTVIAGGTEGGSGSCGTLSIGTVFKRTRCSPFHW